MKVRPELSLLTVADNREVIPRETPQVHPLDLSAVWGGKGPQIASAVWGGKGQSKPRVWTSSTSWINSIMWQASTIK